jgi:RimJ/RimL family protein N-acetyltransferase
MSLRAAGTRAACDDPGMRRPTSPPVPFSDGVVALRRWEHADAPAIARICSDEELVRWLDGLPSPYTEDDARAWIAHGDAGWRGEEDHTPLAIVRAATGELLGSIAVTWKPHDSAEVGYWVAAEARGRGVATRATRLVARGVLGDVGFERLQLQADPRNAASCRVAERAGFTLEGTKRSARWNRRQKRRIDLNQYALLRSEL